VGTAEPLLNTGLVSNVAADEFAAEVVGGVHDDEAASGRVDYKVAQLRHSTDQPGDESDRLEVRVQFPIDPTPPFTTCGPVIVRSRQASPHGLVAAD
jgi:hypothetical protein